LVSLLSAAAAAAAVVVEAVAVAGFLGLMALLS
jgi:hypothetical protein